MASRFLSSIARVSTRSFTVRALSTRSFAASSRTAAASVTAVADKLSKALNAELREEQDQYEQPSVIQTFLRETDWKLTEKDGEINMKLQRQLNGKNVTVEWQLVSPFNREMDFPEEGEEEESQMDQMESTDFTITVADSSEKGVTFYCSTSAGEGHRYVIGNVRSFQSTSERESMTSYNGPDFEDLQEPLQEGFDEFLASAGINDQLADFIDASAVDKEQREYIRWLKNVQATLSA